MCRAHITCLFSCSALVGPTWTAGVAKFMERVASEAGQTVDEAVESYFTKREPTSLLARFLKVEEVAATILFLGSKLGAGVNGAAQKCEGGIIRSI